MRRHAADLNQSAIIKHLETIRGCMVMNLSQVGNGCPDLLVGYQHRNIFLEIKESAKSKIQPKQINFRVLWPGEHHIVYNPEMAANAVLYGSVLGKK